jgi:hypothetical protein
VARNAREEIVAGVMGEVLGVEEVGVEEHFFEAGGHSLLGLELLKVLSQVFGVAIPVRALLEDPTVAGMTRRIERELERSTVPHARGRGADYLLEVKEVQPQGL